MQNKDRSRRDFAPRGAQGALEYLLLIGGAVVVASVVLVLILGISSTSGGGTKSAAAVLFTKQLVAASGAGYWKFDENSAVTQFRDETGQTPLFRHNLANTVAGKFGNAIQISPSISQGCDNQDAGVESATLSDSLKNLPLGSYTISWWNYLPTNAGSTRINFATNAPWPLCGNCSNWTLLNYQNIMNTASDGSGSFSFTAPSVSQWHHFAYVFDRSANKASMYVDGALAGQGTLPAGSYGTALWLSVGTYHSDCVDAIPGAIYDDLLIVNRPLSEQEIKTLAAG